MNHDDRYHVFWSTLYYNPRHVPPRPVSMAQHTWFCFTITHLQAMECSLDWTSRHCYTSLIRFAENCIKAAFISVSSLLRHKQWQFGCRPGECYAQFNAHIPACFLCIDMTLNDRKSRGYQRMKFCKFPLICLFGAWLQVSAAVWMRSSTFWNVTQSRLFIVIFGLLDF